MASIICLGLRAYFEAPQSKALFGIPQTIELSSSILSRINRRFLGLLMSLNKQSKQNQK